jgi:putative transposase
MHNRRGYDFVADRTHDGQPFRILNLIDEYSRKCLVLRVRRELKAQDVVEVLAEQFFSKKPTGPI